MSKTLRRFMIIALAVITIVTMILSFTLQAGGAVGINPQINFQGRLLTPSGAPVPDGTYNMEFRIFQDGTATGGGSIEWTETRTGGNRVQVTDGYFSILLGEVAAFGSSVDWNQDTLWLSVQIGGRNAVPVWDGEMSPRKRLGSVPQAFNADTVDGASAGTGANNVLLLDGSGNISIGGAVNAGGNVSGASLLASGNVSGVNLLGSGGLDVVGTLQAGSSNITVTTAAGFLDADALQLIASDGAGGTSSGSGLEVDSDRLGLLQGCTDSQVLKWTDGTSIWACAADATGGSPSLQGAYDGGNTITTSDNRNILFTLADTTTDSDFIVDMLGTGNTIEFRDSGTAFATFSGTGTILFQPAADSTSFFRILNQAGTTTVLRTDTINNLVTIGIGAPQDLTGNILTVRKDYSGFTRLELNNADASGGTTVRFYSGGTIKSSIFYTNSTDLLTATSLGSILFQTAGSDRLQITSGGLISIAAGASPSAKLDIVNTGTSPYTTTGLRLQSTFTPSGGGTQTNIQVNTTNAATSAPTTTRSIEINLTDGTSLANTNIGLFVDGTTANASDTVIGVDVQNSATTNTNVGVRIRGTSTGTIDTGILMLNTSTGVITTAIDVSDAEIATALAIGANDISTSAGNGSVFNCAASEFLQDPQVQAGIVVAGTCATGTSTLQSAYEAGNTITTTEADGNIAFTLADTTTDHDFIIDLLGTGNIVEFRDSGTGFLTFADTGIITHTYSGTTHPHIVQGTITGSGTVNLGRFLLTNNTTSGTQSAFFIGNEDGSTGVTENILHIANRDNQAVTNGLQISDDLSGGGITTGILIQSTVGGTITTAVDLTDTDIGTGISLGANDIQGTTAVINFSNFDVASTGQVDFVGGLQVNTSGELTDTNGFVIVNDTLDVLTQIRVDAGSAASPAVTVRDDPDTGIFFVAAGGNTVGFATGGSERVRVKSEGVSFYTAADPGARIDISNTGTAPYTFTGLRLQTTFSPSSGGTQDNVQITTTNAPTSTANTARGLVLRAVDTTALANSNVTLYIDPSTANTSDANIGIDIDNASTTTVATGIRIQGSSTGAVTTALDVSDAEIGTALAIGANDITGTTPTVNFTNFDLAGDGSFTLANTGSTNSILNLTSTGDFVIQDAGTPFMTLSDTGGFDLTLDATDNPAFTVTDNGNGDIVFALNSTGDFYVRPASTDTLLITGAGTTVWTVTGSGYSIENPTANNVITNLSSTGDFVIQDAGTAFATFADDGTILFKSSTNSTTAFEVEPSGSSTPVLAVDTSNSRVGINIGSPTDTLDIDGTVRYRVDARTIASTGDANPATLTLEPNRSYVEITCNDPDTCDITMSETNANQGQIVYITNVTTNVVDFADSSGVSELAGAFAAGQYDTITLIYTSDRWVELDRSDN